MATRIQAAGTSLALAAVSVLLAACSGTDAAVPEVDPSELPTGVLSLPPFDQGKRYATLDAGRYRIELNDTLSFDVDLPQDTYAHSDGAFITSGEVILRVTDQGYT
ncbi:MAG TPA: hypothetical protein VLI04_00210, partial [Nocardioidaceae bacterium]|nr:hypothetical protein [Nocardioidaceae bacterium]